MPFPRFAVRRLMVAVAIMAGLIWANSAYRLAVRSRAWSLSYAAKAAWLDKQIAYYESQVVGVESWARSLESEGKALPPSWEYARDRDRKSGEKCRRSRDHYELLSQNYNRAARAPVT